MYKSLLTRTLTLWKRSLITSKEVLVLCPFANFTPTSNNRNFHNVMDNSNVNKLFQGIEDRYNGVTIDSNIESCNFEDFPNKLKDSLIAWATAGRRGIWFKIHLKESDWVPVLAKSGFEFHHAREGSVMMYKWLPKDEPCNVPPYAHTNMGVGAIVINDANQVLVVREKYLKVPHWKLPGGYVERGEDISDAAIREVKEETGIDTEFHSIVAFRHAHKMMFENSDIYMIVNLIPKSTDIVQCKRELMGCQWMDVEEYLNHPDVHTLNRMLVQKLLEYKSKGIKFSGIKDTYQMYTMRKEFTVFTLSNL